MVTDVIKWHWGPHKVALRTAMVTRNKVALKTTCNKNVKFKIIKIRISCQYAGYFYYSENLKWATQNLQLGRMRPMGWT